MDVLILEVGLGGRFDATNVVPHPLLSLIMSISIDHTDFLGDTIEKIAMEKSGIIKKNCPVVLYSQAELVYNIIKDAAARMDAPFYCLNDAKIRVASQTLEGTVFSVKNKCFSLENLELSLLGTYQLENCLAVLEACLVLNKNGLSIPEGAIRNGLKNARWAGRMELCGRARLSFWMARIMRMGFGSWQIPFRFISRKKRLPLFSVFWGIRNIGGWQSRFFPLRRR